MENTIIDRRILHAGMFVNKIEVDEQTQDGTIKTWEGASRTGTGEVVGVLVENKNKGTFVLVEQFRPLVNSRVLELVAGVVDKGDTKEETVSNEIKQETGYVSDKITFLMGGPKSAGFGDEYVYYYYSEVSGCIGEQELEKDEIGLEVIEIKNTISDLLKLCDEKEKLGVMVCPSIWGIIGRGQAMGIEFKN